MQPKRISCPEGFPETQRGAYNCSYDDRQVVSREHVAYSQNSSTAIKVLNDAPPLTPRSSPFPSYCDTPNAGPLCRNTCESLAETWNGSNRDGDPRCGIENGNVRNGGLGNGDHRNGVNSATMCSAEELCESDFSRDFSKQCNSPSPSISWSDSNFSSCDPKHPTNNLSTEKAPQPPTVSATRNGTLPQNIVYVPVQCVSFISSAGAVPFVSVPVTLAIDGACGGAGLMMSAPTNMYCPPLVNHDARAAAMSASYTSNTALDSRNVLPPRNEYAPSSGQNNNSSGGQSYSLNPSGDTSLKRLRKPVLEWIRKKLDTPNGSNWEALADIHGWLYEDISCHLHECRHKGVSPFKELLETDTFLTYTVNMFLEDMRRLRRVDILNEFDYMLKQANS